MPTSQTDSQEFNPQRPHAGYLEPAIIGGSKHSALTISHHAEKHMHNTQIDEKSILQFFSRNTQIIRRRLSFDMPSLHNMQVAYIQEHTSKVDAQTNELGAPLFNSLSIQNMEIHLSKNLIVYEASLIMQRSIGRVCVCA